MLPQHKPLSLFLLIECNGTGLRLYSNTTSIINDTAYITGIPLLCGPDGYLFGLCNDGTISQETSDLYCRLLRYEGQREREKEGEGEGEGERGREREWDDCYYVATTAHTCV